MFSKLLNGAASPANCAKKIAGPLMVFIVPSTPPSVYDEVLRCAFFRRVRRQEQRHVRDVARKHTRLHALTGHNFLLELRRIPQFDLPLSPNSSRRNRVDPYAEGPEFAGQYSCQPRDGSLGYVINRSPRQLQPPNNGAQIDDGASAKPLHLWRGGLRRKEHVPQVYRDALIPVVRCDLVERVAVVVAGIVDEHSNVAQLDADFFDSRPQGGEVVEVAIDEVRRGSRLFLNLSDQHPTLFLRDIHETHTRPLPGEGAREGRTNTASSAGDEDRFVCEPRVPRRSACIHMPRPP